MTASPLYYTMLHADNRVTHNIAKKAAMVAIDTAIGELLKLPLDCSKRIDELLKEKQRIDWLTPNTVFGT
ncbi:MAG: hypothetical protein WKF89_05300 [Chitinophagaceae bacterium]